MRNLRLLKLASLISFMAALSLAACAQSPAVVPAPAATPTTITPDQGKGGIVGIVENSAQIWQDQELIIYAAEYVGEEDSGFFLLEPNLFPKSLVEPDGKFQINNVPPGRYVLVVGPKPDLAKLIGADTSPRIVEVAMDAITDIGAVTAMQ